ncbi:MAG: hypothetical protein ABFS35_20115 [Bacteroidota bacterium]
MQQTIDINLLKENPLLFFSQLDKDAEKEFVYFLEYFIFKHEINLKKGSKKKLKVLNKIPEGIITPIKIKGFRKFSREELHER